MAEVLPCFHELRVEFILCILDHTCALVTESEAIVIADSSSKGHVSSSKGIRRLLLLIVALRGMCPHLRVPADRLLKAQLLLVVLGL